MLWLISCQLYLVDFSKFYMIFRYMYPVYKILNCEFIYFCLCYCFCIEENGILVDIWFHLLFFKVCVHIFRKFCSIEILNSFSSILPKSSKNLYHTINNEATVFNFCLWYLPLSPGPYCHFNVLLDHIKI